MYNTNWNLVNRIMDMDLFLTVVRSFLTMAHNFVLHNFTKKSLPSWKCFTNDKAAFEFVFILQWSYFWGYCLWSNKTADTKRVRKFLNTLVLVNEIFILWATFCVFLHHNNSLANWARELFKPSKDVESFDFDKIGKFWILFFCGQHHNRRMFRHFWPRSSCPGCQCQLMFLVEKGANANLCF